jgi:hypothetical protein
MTKQRASDNSRSKADAPLLAFGKRIAPLLDTINSRSRQETGDRLRAFHRIGCELLRLNRSHVYRLAKLTEVLGYDRHRQREVRKFATLYDPQQLQALCGQADGVSWGHLRLLLGMSPKQRETWLGRIRQNGWSVNVLQRELKSQGMMAAGGGARGGRPLGGSRKQPAIQLRRMRELTADWSELAREVLEARKNDALPQLSGLDKAFWDRLQKAVESTDRLQTKFKKLRVPLDRAIATAKRQKAAEAEE